MAENMTPNELDDVLETKAREIMLKRMGVEASAPATVTEPSSQN